ncbi:hypothetical protein [Saccharibacillus kuerlensis]|uniref:Uncharacterized protein n=1 Tax=Saccharibacillus kuerlensis TaxID=459527 RepID=A0ABQ2L950_9BACL|nr:hypothetical protein [Saccharibacillus kuerlensis]GGO07224.1 hypothetical protein GCM10010969_35530 [Saccharibacillus kuerlensis]
MKYITGIFAALLAVLLLFMYPLYEQARSQDKIANAIVQGAATHFIDSVRTKGYITPQMYEEFNTKLAATGNQYDVQLEHLHKRYNPDYNDPANPLTFQGSFTTFYDGFYTEQILAVLFPDNGRSPEDAARRYTMEVGDYIGVKLKNVNRTAAVQLWDFLMNDNTEENAAVLMNYEGMILNEDY